jgi:mannose-6-phosphate isomerase-like protein (cupin superfamily)
MRSSSGVGFGAAGRMLVPYIDPVKVSPDNYRVLLENHEVRVLRMTLRPGEKDKMHSHPNETVYFLNGGNVKIRLENGDVVEAEIPDNEVMWNQAWTHQVENVGSKTVRAIIVENKLTKQA